MFVGFLAQFPQSFRENPENREYLEKLRELFPDKTVICEFRQEDWLTPDSLKLVKKLGFPVSTVDEPNMSTLPGSEVVFTKSPAYVRLHGRNYKGWYKGSMEERYTYNYSREELNEWIGKVKALTDRTKNVFILFNNHPQGYAGINAHEFIEMLNEALPGLVAEPREVTSPIQGGLFDNFAMLEPHPDGEKESERPEDRLRSRVCDCRRPVGR